MDAYINVLIIIDGCLHSLLIIMYEWVHKFFWIVIDGYIQCMCLEHSVKQWAVCEPGEYYVLLCTLDYLSTVWASECHNLCTLDCCTLLLCVHQVCRWYVRTPVQVFFDVFVVVFSPVLCVTCDDLWLVCYVSPVMTDSLTHQHGQESCTQFASSSLDVLVYKCCLWCNIWCAVYHIITDVCCHILTYIFSYYNSWYLQVNRWHHILTYIMTY